MATTDIPRSVLSEYFQDRLSGRRIVGMLFLTFEFDPGFFEQEVLPALLDTPVSHAEVPRLMQLEAALRDVAYGVTVIYDQAGLIVGASKAPRLDIRRIPARVPTGIFHPKNVLVLTKDIDANKDGEHTERLLVAALSANLTRGGWWENVEVCHAEDLEEGETTCLRDSLLELLGQCRKHTDNPVVADVLEPFRKFVHHRLTQRSQRSQNGVLWPQMYVGGQDVADFLADTIPRDSGYCLEVISPFFDKSADSTPLKRLIRRLGPEEVRVYLPKNPAGEAACSPEFFAAVREQEGVSWAALPEDLLRLGKGANAGTRGVHAKVYRVFKRVPKREYLFVGSANLTTAAHSSKGGNVESGLLVEVVPERKPEFWLMTDMRKPEAFAAPEPEESLAERVELPAQVRFSWTDGKGYGFWDVKDRSPVLTLKVGGVVVGQGLQWPGREWTELPSDVSARLQEELRAISLLTVAAEDGREAVVLVQEEGTALKPDLTRTLPVADILEYWALLKPEQRQAFLETREDLLTGSAVLDPLSVPQRLAPDRNDMFQRCAGIFHSFSSLERRVLEALEQQHEGQAVALLFGERFDSLGPVLARVLKPDAEPEQEWALDLVNRYLILMCATQLMDGICHRQPDFWKKFVDQTARIRTLIAQRDEVRQALIASDPANLPDFLTWFDRWFLERAEPVEVA